MSSPATRTTLQIPADVLRRIDHAVAEGRAHSRDSFVTAALRRELATQEHAAMDAIFADMAADAAYQEEALAIARDFERADAEALRQSEQMK